MRRWGGNERDEKERKRFNGLEAGGCQLRIFLGELDPGPTSAAVFSVIPGKLPGTKLLQGP